MTDWQGWDGWACVVIAVIVLGFLLGMGIRAWRQPPE